MCLGDGCVQAQAAVKWRNKKWTQEEFTLVDITDEKRNQKLFFLGHRPYEVEIDRLKEMWIIDARNSFTINFVKMLKYYEERVNCKGRILDIICENHVTDFDGSYQMQKRVKFMCNLAWSTQFRFF